MYKYLVGNLTQLLHVQCFMGMKFAAELFWHGFHSIMSAWWFNGGSM